MTKRQWRSLIGLVLAIIVGLAKVYFGAPAPVSESGVPSPSPSTVATETHSAAPIVITTSTNALVLEVMDGDTIKVLQDGEQVPKKVRFLGVNTPESVDPRRPVECFGKEASHFTKQLLQDRRVLLKEDLQADDLDKYGRFLRNIFLEDGTDVNALLIKQGYAYAYVSLPQEKRRKNELTRLQAEAKKAQVGLWNPDTCGGMK